MKVNKLIFKDLISDYYFIVTSFRGEYEGKNSRNR